MSKTTESAAVRDARIDELEELLEKFDTDELVQHNGDEMTIFDIYRYLIDRLAQLYPPDFMAYRQRWAERCEDHPDDEMANTLLSYRDWLATKQELAEQLARLAEEGKQMSARVMELRYLLVMSDGGVMQR